MSRVVPTSGRSDGYNGNYLHAWGWCPSTLSPLLALLTHSRSSLFARPVASRLRPCAAESSMTYSFSPCLLLALSLLGSRSFSSHMIHCCASCFQLVSSSFYCPWPRIEQEEGGRVCSLYRPFPPLFAPPPSIGYYSQSRMNRRNNKSTVASLRPESPLYSKGFSLLCSDYRNPKLSLTHSPSVCVSSLRRFSYSDSRLAPDSSSPFHSSTSLPDPLFSAELLLVSVTCSFLSRATYSSPDRYFTRLDKSWSRSVSASSFQYPFPISYCTNSLLDAVSRRTETTGSQGSVASLILSHCDSRDR